MKVQNLKSLMIREFWENRGLLFRTPLTISIILIIIASIGTFQAVKFAPWSHDDLSHKFEWKEKLDIDIDQEDGLPWDKKNRSEDDDKKSLFDVTRGLASISMLFGGLLSLFYLSQSLYQDRKDRSILFWRSLPISESETIASKLLTGMLVFPVVFAVFAVLTTMASLLIFAIGASLLGASSLVTFVFSHLLSLNFLKALLFSITSGGLFVISLMPFYCWFLLSSAFSRRSPLLISLGIPFAIVITEGVVLHSTNFGSALGRFLTKLFFNANSVASFELASVNWLSYLVSFAIAAAMLVATHWLRNNRYEL